MSKYPVGETVRVTNPSHDKFDQVGTVTHHRAGITYPFRVAFRVGQTGELFRASELTLADPDVHTVLDQMDAEGAPDTRGMVDGDAKSEGAPERTGITAEDKLRLIADTVERQSPFGTELANFRRRLSAILSIGHDA